MEREHRRKLLNRLSRIEGQVRGIARMIEEERYSIDVQNQLQAVRAASTGVETQMLKDHLNSCIEGSMSGADAKDRRASMDELMHLLERGLR